MKNDYFFVYETTNLINGKKYRGIHKTSNINDNYIGSGIPFTNAVKKYGKENFKRDILEFCDSYDELLEKEKIYVDEEWVKNRTNYNIKTGGQSSGILSDESKKKISETLKRKYKNGELIATIGERIKITGSWCKGLKMNDEFKKKCSEAAKKRYKDDENHPLKLFGSKINTEEQKKKISETLKERYKTMDHHCKGKPSPIKGKKRSTPVWNKGKKGLQVSCNKGKKMEKIECPHCGKFIDKLNAKRWHFDNCKLSDSYKKPEYKPMSEDCKNKISEKLKIRYKNKEHHLKGIPSWNKGKIMEKIECPNCNKLISKGKGYKYHLDKCKFISMT